MTEENVKNALFSRFLNLNTFSNISFLVIENNEVKNVALPNKNFTPPDNCRWFALSFMPDVPEQISVGYPSLVSVTGIFQIDIYTPLDKGEAEADTKYEWISKLFAPGTEIGSSIIINKVYSPDSTPEKNVYKKIVRVEWTADIDKGA